jgi:membrane protease subunit HflC
MKTITGVVAVLIALVAIVLYSSIFFVHQTQQALVLRFGEPRRIIVDPGLQYKAPLIDTVILIDKRILDLDNPPQEVIASDQKRLVVDAFARYRITDPLKFYQSVATIEGANSRLLPVLNSSMRRVLGESTFIEVARICRKRTVRRSISACRPSVSERRPKSAPRATRRARRSAPRPIAT